MQVAEATDVGSTVALAKQEADAYLQAFAVIAEKKPKDRIAAIKKLVTGDEVAARIIKMALDPGMRFYTTTVPDGMLSDDKALELTDVLNALETISNEELRGSLGQNALHNVLPNGYCGLHELVQRIVNKDLRINAGPDSVNKAVKGFIPVFKCMLSHKYEEKRIAEWPVLVEPKLDGIRVIAIGSAVEDFIFYTRTGKMIETMGHVSRELQDWVERSALENDKLIAFDGEAVTTTFNDTTSQVRKKDGEKKDIVFHVFDMVPADKLLGLDKIASPAPLLKRRLLMGHLWNEWLVNSNPQNVKLVQPRTCHNNAEVMSYYQEIRDQGGEGVIVKPQDGLYEKRRSYNWLKIKDQQTVDVTIIDFEAGTAGTKYEHCLGALVVDYKGVNVRVGSGLTDELREDIWADKESHLGRLIEVEFHEETPDGSLRHPRFNRFRDDKPTEDGVGV